MGEYKKAKILINLWVVAFLFHEKQTEFSVLKYHQLIHDSRNFTSFVIEIKMFIRRVFHKIYFVLNTCDYVRYL